MKKKKDRIFHIIDLDCDVIVEYDTRKNLLDSIDNYVENLGYDFFDPSYDSFSILYKDGAEDCIDQSYDGHKIRKQHIQSIIWNNPESSVVYGNFYMNEYGVTTVAFQDEINKSNIVEKLEDKK